MVVSGKSEARKLVARFRNVAEDSIEAIHVYGNHIEYCVAGRYASLKVKAKIMEVL